MKFYEYMGKELFSRYGIPVPAGRTVESAAQAQEVFSELNRPVVIKSQVLSGKRGKAGGIRFADSAREAGQQAAELLATSIQGQKVEKLLVEEKLSIDSELYMSITVDTKAKKPVLIASTQGGMDIEEVPEQYIIKRHIDPAITAIDYIGREIAGRLGLKDTHYKEASRLIVLLYRLFKEKDAELVEINPLVISGEHLYAADAKVTIDDEALFRQKDLPFVDDRTEAEKAAHKLGLSYVQLEGNIAVMANGAGITMGTLDTLSYFGGSPANFLDAGGGTGTEATASALEILLSANPKAIFINIFGGITRCDDVARAVVQVKNTRDIKVPMVIRLVGTNEEEGVNILRENGISAYQVMVDAAQKACELAQRD